jgi:DNA (cytosine-5)-methyltransferase 1
LFKNKGYNTQFVKVNCLDIGMAQMRKRILFFAWQDGPDELKFSFSKQPKMLQDVIYDIRHEQEGSQEFERDNQKYLIASRIKTRQKLCNVRGGVRAVLLGRYQRFSVVSVKNEKDVLVLLRSLRRKHRVRDFGDADPVPISLLQQEYGKGVSSILESLIKKGFVRKVEEFTYDLTMTFNGKYRRLAWDMPSPTVDTRFGSPVYFLHPEKNRGFTVREAARIQGFDDDFEFGIH